MLAMLGFVPFFNDQISVKRGFKKNPNKQKTNTLVFKIFRVLFFTVTLNNTLEKGKFTAKIVLTA